MWAGCLFFLVHMHNVGILFLTGFFLCTQSYSSHFFPFKTFLLDVFLSFFFRVVALSSTLCFFFLFAVQDADENGGKKNKRKKNKSVKQILSTPRFFLSDSAEKTTGKIKCMCVKLSD